LAIFICSKIWVFINMMYQIHTMPAGNRLTPVGVSADGKTAHRAIPLNGQTYTGTIRKMVRNGNVIPGGGTIWQDTNNDGLIDDRDRVVLGNAIPKVYLGFNNFFRYKDFTLNFLFTGAVWQQGI
jgi:hypothetical protein